MFIAYIYDINGDVIAQVEEILDFETTQKLNDISTASFALYHTNEYCKRSFLKEYMRIKIGLVKDNTENVIFDWVIRWFDADLAKTTIKMESFEHVCSRRLLHQDLNFTNTAISSILVQVIDHLDSVQPTWFGLDCTVTTTLSKQYKKWDTFLSVLQDLADAWFEFCFIDKTLIFKQTIGIDRTSIGDDFVEYRFDSTEPDDRTIDTIKMVVDWKELATWVLGKSWSNFSFLSDPTAVAEYGLIETSFSNSWDQAVTTQSLLDDHKQSMSEFDVDAISQNFFEANLWDIVKVFVYVWNDIMFFDGSMKVVQKKYTHADLAKIQFGLSKSKARSKDIIETISDLQSRIKNLEMK